jgi:glutamine synthetase type III
MAGPQHSSVMTLGFSLLKALRRRACGVRHVSSPSFLFTCNVYKYRSCSLSRSTWAISEVDTNRIRASTRNKRTNNNLIKGADMGEVITFMARMKMFPVDLVTAAYALDQSVFGLARRRSRPQPLS